MADTRKNFRNCICKLGCGVNVELPSAGFKLSMAWVSDIELEDDWLIRHLGWSKRRPGFARRRAAAAAQ
jgi:hypothetical protein